MKKEETIFSQMMKKHKKLNERRKEECYSINRIGKKDLYCKNELENKVTETRKIKKNEPKRPKN